MVSMFKKLGLLRSIEFDEGRISFLGDRIQILAAEILADLVYYGDEECMRAQYKACRETTYEHFDKIKGSGKLADEKITEMAINMVSEMGWGKPTILEDEREKGHITIAIEDASIGSTYLLKHGRSKEPVCHLERGGLAGGIGALLGRDDLAVVETKCIAMGDPRCEFVCRPLEELKKEYSNEKLVRGQLDNI